MALTFAWESSLRSIPAHDWNRLTDGSPITSHAFLSALEESGSVGGQSGWEPLHLVVYEGDALVGAMPLYVKAHSYGEYVFDWAWANAYTNNGMPYYPKLLCALPFTPISGARLLSRDADIKLEIVKQLRQQTLAAGLSSAHILFTRPEDSALLRQSGWIERTGVQFRWENCHYSSWEAFLSTLSHDKRKKIRQERKKVVAADIRCEIKVGHDIQADDWAFFYACYVNTYRQHHSSPYLTPSFFERLSSSMAEHTVLILAYQGDRRIAASFLLAGEETGYGKTLYGRYWGATEYVPNLHFELCYYQAQEYCIRQGIRFFEGGAQGEHKLARGFTPQRTHSFHFISHPSFDEAIRAFVEREQSAIAHYQHELEERAPYHQDSNRVVMPDNR